jgi:hypothetical protein
MIKADPDYIRWKLPLCVGNQLIAVMWRWDRVPIQKRTIRANRKDRLNG